MNEKIDIIPETRLGTGVKMNRTNTTQNALERRVNAVFIPYGTLEQLRDNAMFRIFLRDSMHNLQKAGENFMDALMKSAKEWNNSHFAQTYKFRMITNIGPIKSQRGEGGKLVKVENQIYLKKVLGIQDYKTKSICDALGFTERELWPEVIQGKNQYTDGKMHPNIQSGKNQFSKRFSSLEDYKNWWKNGWKTRYLELRKEKMSPRDAIRQAGKEYNDQQISDETRLNIEGLVKIYQSLLQTK